MIGTGLAGSLESGCKRALALSTWHWRGLDRIVIRLVNVAAAHIDAMRRNVDACRDTIVFKARQQLAIGKLGTGIYAWKFHGDRSSKAFVVVGCQRLQPVGSPSYSDIASGVQAAA
jgi:hypothetical protein